MSNQQPSDRNTRLAMATAALGMCMGITPVTSLAMNTDSAADTFAAADQDQVVIDVAPESQQLAAAYIKFDGVDGESKAQPTPQRQWVQQVPQTRPDNSPKTRPNNVPTQIRPQQQKPRAGYIKIGDIKGE